MNVPKEIRIYGQKIKGCKIPESAHSITFFNTLRTKYPEYAGACFHVRNEGKRTPQQIEREKAEGFLTGVSDIILPGSPSFVCELKSQSTTAKTSNEQIKFLLAAQSHGAFVCVALGHEAAMNAFCDWLEIINKNNH